MARRGRQEVLIEVASAPGQLHATGRGNGRAGRARLPRPAGTCQDDPGTCGLVFKNYGPRAGASLGHIPQPVRRRWPDPTHPRRRSMQSFRKHHDQHGMLSSCVSSSRQSTGDHALVIVRMKTGSCSVRRPAVSLTKSASLPPAPGSFRAAGDPAVPRPGATSSRTCCGALEELLPIVAYNFWIHTAAFDGRRQDHYHWHVEITPRLTIQAGFEWGSGAGSIPYHPNKRQNNYVCWKTTEFC